MDRRKFLKNTGWSMLGLAASGSLLNACLSESASNRRKVPAPLKGKFYWGDVHNHCNLTYGHGDMKDAFEAAKEQLDFVSVTPHALWPDIPGRDDKRLSWVIDYHTGAFKRLREGGYEKYTKMNKQYNEEGKFLSFLSYECHSMRFGDHVALNYDLDAPLLECKDVPDLRNKLRDKKAFLTPHHMGYQSGYRGYNWRFFEEGRMTPFVEMYSRHGLAETDEGDYNYLHDMGPRQWEGTILCGLEQGHKFGIMGSTDQHAGYPGSYGDGRMGVFASSLKRSEIWDAMQNRQVCGVTGDKITIDFRLNDAMMGEVVKGNTRNIYLNIEGQSGIDYVDLVKNGRVVARMNGPLIPEQPKENKIRAKIKIDFGWNREEEYIKWLGNIHLTKGKILQATPCFRGAAFTSPQPGEHSFKTRVNRIHEKTDKKVNLEMYSSKNPNTTTAAYQGVQLDVEMPLDGEIVTEFNGERFSHSLETLLEGSRAHFMRGWLSESILFNRAYPESAFMVEHFMQDEKPERDTDYYYVRVRQRNQQWAWSSPIWVERM